MANIPLGSELQNESDVEQKVLLPLLTGPSPDGLGLSIEKLYTKASIRSVVIDKGMSKKNYYPDYIYTHKGAPILVVEAKTPGEDLLEALREARLYASEINSHYPANIDPVRFVIASDGKSLLAGYNNSATPIYDLSIEDWSHISIEFADFVKNFSSEALRKWGESVAKEVRPKRYWKPRKMVGGVSAQSEEIGLNSFGVTIKSDFKDLFNPSSIEDRDIIAKECYIPSKRRDRYVDSIDRAFKAIIPPSENNTTAIDDTSRPDRLIKKLRQGTKLNNEVMLLIGAAGAGKTTFIDYLRVQALPRDVRQGTRWIHINMNLAPVSDGEIFSWLRKEIISGIKRAQPSIDFDELDTIKQIFRNDVEKFRKGTGRLHEHSSEKYAEKLAEAIERALSDQHYVAQAYCDYVSRVESSLIVIALDNCDKLAMQEQLLMFEASQWLRTEFNAMVLLPLREETYDNNQNVPPLDTALKDLAFRIEPPRFDLILRSRVDLAVRRLQLDPTQKFSYDLPNSMKAVYMASDKISYFSSILKSIFDADSNVRRLLIGLSGRNMRRAMEIFLDFCSSGHISEEHILKMVQSKGVYVLPLDIVSKVILRSKMRYYDSDFSYVVNLFSSDIDDSKPNFITRVAILRYLTNLAEIGKGSRASKYAKGADILAELKKLGITEESFIRELNYLTVRNCVVSEDFRLTNITLDDLITIGPAGRTHLYLIGSIHYLAAISEDTWFRDEKLARSISDRIKDDKNHFNPRTVVSNAKAVVDFLDKEINAMLAEHDLVFPEDDTHALSTISSAKSTVDRRQRELFGAWADIDDRLPVDEPIIGQVTNITKYGLFVRLEPNVDGLLHITKLSGVLSDYKKGDSVTVLVKSIDASNRKIELASP
ncbi:S1 RNA-binding domain-containing protein [Maribius pontilimi]|uniref:S1 RNA-binding domain-containing protein n=1 Tax=Palleronia pontilimi TaxID=1964209 RepID=A0A934MB51_9RHOB|nr:type I restriction enzyme HsdR N-terminal domain-containing protein [Palleronia pontilimi]MBJ3764372.1 S1 RNA-binding domain-containing protein [Palleronia pontilimi]